MSVHKRDGGAYYIRLRWRDVPPMFLSTGTSNKKVAEDMEGTLRRLYHRGRLDLLGLLKARRVTIRQLYDADARGPAALAHVGEDSPVLGPLVAEWLKWCASPAGVSPRTKRRYAAKTVRRYGVSWEGFFEVLPRHREARLADLTAGFLADYKASRVRAQAGGGRKRKARQDRPLAVATVNRDLVALGAFLTWCTESRGLALVRPKFNREHEPAGRERWLSADELRALEAACLDRWPEWWALFATLAFTGMRYGEAAGLRGGDVQVAAGRIVIHEGARRVKTASSVRDVPIPEPLARVLGVHLARVSPGPAALVFPAPLSRYDRAYETFKRACIAAGIHDGKPGDEAKPKKEREGERDLHATATIHDLRHTFGVHAAQAGVPIVRLQKLLGHATPTMTMRYMKHAPEAYFEEDAARIAASMTAKVDPEAEARAKQAREGLRSA